MHLLSLMNWKPEELKEVLRLSSGMRGKLTEDLRGKTAALLFEKPSTRTRVSFEVGIFQMGGYPLYMDASTTQLSRGETVRDMALVMSRYVDLFIARVYSHSFLEEFARWSSIPVINALSDRFHPCQALADVLTMEEKKTGKLKVAFVGDGNNNVTHSLMLAACMLGHEVWVGCPKKYAPEKDVVKAAGNVVVTEDPVEAVDDADVVYTDVWVSMGREDREERLEAFKEYQVNSRLVSHAKKNYIFMHCLPAHIGQEVTEDVIYSKNSVVFDQAENRLHAQKGLIRYLMRKQI